PPLGVSGGSVLLVDPLPYLAADAIVLAIFDPSVGRDRDVALEAADERLIVGPDNGLLAPAAAALGGVTRAVEITSSEVVLTPVSPSFHARDVLAPAAAHLAAGADLATLAEAVEPATLGALAIPDATVERGKIECEVLDLNRFGNVLLNVREAQLIQAGLDGAGGAGVGGSKGVGVGRRVEGRPGDGVRSEEGERAVEGRGRTWVVDPLDGTREFGEPGREDWAVHVALVVDEQAVAGAVALPARGAVLSTGSPPALPPGDDRPPRVVVSRTRPPAFAEAFAE